MCFGPANAILVLTHARQRAGLTGMGLSQKPVDSIVHRI